EGGARSFLPQHLEVLAADLTPEVARLLEERRGLGDVFRHRFALVVHDGELGAALGRVEIAGALVVGEGLLGVGLHALALAVDVAQVEAAEAVAQTAGLLVVALGLGEVFRRGAAPAIGPGAAQVVAGGAEIEGTSLLFERSPFALVARRSVA